MSYRRRRGVALFGFGFVAVSLLLCFTRLSSTSLPGSISELVINKFSPNKAAPAPLRQALEDAKQKDLDPMAYGTSARPPIKGLVHMATLPKDYVPTVGGPPGRLVIIGDVHGQLAALRALLDKLDFDKKKGDHLVFTGDMISKGPDSAGVVALAMELGACGVRGNHEDRVLLAYSAMEAPGVTAGDDKQLKREGQGTNGTDEAIKAQDPNEKATPPAKDDMSEPVFSHGDYKDREVGRTLTASQRQWLSRLPVILRIGPIPSYGEMVIVHGGLTPSVPLAKQDPWAVMNMRTLVYPGEDVRRENIKKALEEEAEEEAKQSGGSKKDVTNEMVAAEYEKSTGKDHDRDIALPIDGRDGELWTEAWRRAMKGKPENEQMTVVYGHDAKRGLVVEEHTFGLDSSCVKGGKLTAMVLEAGKEKIQHRLVSVECEKAKGLQSDKTI